MKLFAVAAAILFSVSAAAQLPVGKKIAFSYQGASFDPAAVHESGNTFARRVGQELKLHYPVRVVEINIRLTVIKPQDRPTFVLTWTCIVAPATPATADYYFDRRGTMLSGRNLASAQANVELELAESNKANLLIAAFDRSYGNHRAPPEFVQTAWARDYGGTMWFIKEHFVTAHR